MLCGREGNRRSDRHKQGDSQTSECEAGRPADVGATTEHFILLKDTETNERTNESRSQDDSY